MAKLKTRKSVSKRIRITKSGKVKKANACRSHLLTHKSRKRKRHLKQRSLLTSVDAAKARAMLPYGG